MHIRTKFDGGNQINWSQQGSWEGRCTGAGLHLNGGPVWVPTCWEKGVSVPANTIYKHHATTLSKVVEQDRKRKSSLPAKQQHKKSRQASVDNSLSSRSSYSRYDGGPNATDVPQDFPPNHLQDLMISFYKIKIIVTQQRAKEIQLLTMQQRHDEVACSIWKAERRLRITSSIAGTIAKRRPTTQVGTSIRSMLYSKFSGNQATCWGLSQEKATAQQYTVENTTQVTGVSINTECSLVIATDHPWFAATSDGLVNDPQVLPSQGLVEFKNPHSCKDQFITHAVLNKKLTCLFYSTSDALSLKHSDTYYHQVQMAMFCTSKEWCDFVVRTSVDLHVERIRFDEAFCQSILP